MHRLKLGGHRLFSNTGNPQYAFILPRLKNIFSECLLSSILEKVYVVENKKTIRAKNNESWPGVFHCN
jgi:hypothetical protein